MAKTRVSPVYARAFRDALCEIRDEWPERANEKGPGEDVDVALHGRGGDAQRARQFASIKQSPVQVREHRQESFKFLRRGGDPDDYGCGAAIGCYAHEAGASVAFGLLPLGWEFVERLARWRSDATAQ